MPPAEHFPAASVDVRLDGKPLSQTTGRRWRTASSRDSIGVDYAQGYSCSGELLLGRAAAATLFAIFRPIRVATPRRLLAMLAAQEFLDLPRYWQRAALRARARRNRPDRCRSCGDRVPRRAHAKGWRFATCFDGKPRWCCPECR